MAWRVAAVTVAAALCHAASACNVRELSEIIRSRFKQEVVSSCGDVGDKCMFDRECCSGLECKMSASKAGVDNYCHRRVAGVPAGVEREHMENTPLGEYGEESQENEPSSLEDNHWMRVKSEDTEDEKEGESEKKKATDTLGEIERLQEEKREHLLRENEELERLFTEKDEKELEQLRALKEDAEMEELRRLKELRLKRKQQLIKELQELRGLKAQEKFDIINELKNRTKTTEGQDKNNSLVVEQRADNETNLQEDTKQEMTEDETPRATEAVIDFEHLEDQEETGKSEQTGGPDQSMKPNQTELSEQIQNPEQTEGPIQPQGQEQTQELDQTKGPEQPEESNQPQKSEQTQTPDVTKEPEQTQQPEQTRDLGQTQLQEQTLEPGKLQGQEQTLGSNSTTKHRQGIHHRRKHHQPKHKSRA